MKHIKGEGDLNTGDWTDSHTEDRTPEPTKWGRHRHGKNLDRGELKRELELNINRTD